MTGINLLPYAAPTRSSVFQPREFPKRTMISDMRICFLPSPFPLSFFRPRAYPKGYYFCSPQSSTVIKSKMAATTIRTRTMFRPPKIRLHYRLPSSVTFTLPYQIKDVCMYVFTTIKVSRLTAPIVIACEQALCLGKG